MLSSLLNRMGERNPQLFREIKGRLKPRNVAIASAISIVGQILIYFYFASRLPIAEGYNRYCTASDPANSDYASPYCIKDLLGNWMVNWRLWWLDLFTCLSILSIIALLVIGTYLLITDLSKEESRGTLNFIRLSPQSAQSILTGKILGVPILLYLATLLALPLHICSGLAAGIPFGLIMAFYGVLGASCAFFYSGSLLYGMISTGLGNFQPWFGSGAVWFFLFPSTGIALESSKVGHNPFDWLLLFYPGTVLPYLVDATYLPPNLVEYLNFDRLADLLWYGQPLWRNPGIGMSLILLNYGLWTYWVWQALKRRFHNPNVTLLTKQWTYWITGTFVAIAVGFALQTTKQYQLFENFSMVQFLLLVLCLGLTAALTPHRQSLQDWSRYRHQTSPGGSNLLKDLVLGEQSPSTLAIALNLGIAIAYLVPSILLFPLGSYKIALVLGLLLSANMILIYAAIAQLILLLKTKKRTIWAAVSVSALVVLPFVCFLLLEIEPERESWLWLFSSIPVVGAEYASLTTVFLAILGQWSLFVLFSSQISRQLYQAGASETKAVFSRIS